MRAAAAGCLLIALLWELGPAFAAQDGQPLAQVAPRRRIIAVLSDLLVHSPLQECSTPAVPVAHTPNPVRVATWNIRAARTAPLDAIAAEMQAMQADVFALQEVDVRTRRGNFVDEPAALAHALGSHYVFAASIKWDEGDYGLAVLSRWPIAGVRRHRLGYTEGTEPRIVLEVTVCADGRPLHLFNHHADGRAASRAPAFQEVRRIVEERVGDGILVVGDFNEYAGDPGVRALIGTGLVDLGAATNLSTASSGRIDYLLADASIARQVSNARVWPTDKSDHYAVLVDLDWTGRQ
ncbi:MAG: endonuclease/exonuclease/phosphatase family protein [Vicinamibacterales bacterium]